MGSALAGEYTAMGDAVNLAARMEQTAQPGTVQISGDTYRLVSPWVDVEPLGEVEVRGKTEQVPTYRVLRIKETPGKARGLAGLSSPLVGRAREFEKMENALADLRQGRGGVITLIGEAGLGKSRLIEELHARVAGPVGWVESRGISYETKRPYGLFQQHLRQVCQLEEDDSPEAVRQKVEQTFSGLDAENQKSIAHMVEMLLTLHRGGDRHGSSSGQVQAGGDPLPGQGEALKRQIFESSIDLWSGLAERTPLVLVFDDLHWADPASIELIIHLFQLTDQAPILFVCAFRPYRSYPSWSIKTTAETNFPHRYAEISLSPLSETDSGMLVDSLLSISELPSQLRQLVMSKSEGNPFFLEEVVRTLIDHGIIRMDAEDGRWRVAADFGEIDIPDNLQALLLARIDRLEGEARRTLQLASVIGRSFFYRVLQSIADAISSLDQQLVTLQRVELIRELARQPEMEYIFRHELTRDAAYQSILRRQRREFHRKVGEAIESLYPDRQKEEAHRLAYHFDQARDLPRALKYYELAGEHAFRLFANMEASEHFGRAIEIARRLEAPSVQLSHLYLRKGRALELLNKFDQALANYQELEALGRTRIDRSLELAALVPQAAIHSTPTIRFNPQLGQAFSRRALELANDLRDYKAEARALWSLMLLEVFDKGNMQQAVQYGEQGMRLAREYDLREELAQIQHDLGRPYMRLGNLEAAWKVYMDSQLYWRETDNQPMLADNLTSLADTLYSYGDFDRALEFVQEGLHISQQIGNLWGQAYGQMTLAPIYLERGDPDRSLSTLDLAEDLSKKAGFSAGVLYSKMIRIWIYASLGDLATAGSLTEDLRGLVESYNSYQPLYSLAQALTLLYGGEFTEARRSYDTLGSDYVENSEMLFGPYVYTLDLEIALLSGYAEQALERCDHYLGHMAEGGLRILLPDLLNQKARALLALNRREEAYQVLQEARLEAERQNSQRILWAVLLDLADLEPDPQAAAAHRNKAREVIELILEHISSQRLRESFLSLPRVQTIRQHS
jgi:tetratricopeptide (TPR) repeat protein